MSVPVDIADVNVTTSSNSPAGTDAIGTTLDDYIRAHAAFIAQLRDGSKNLTDGSAAAPSSARLSDPNTGMYFPAADYVALTGGGAVWGNNAGVWTNASNTQPCSIATRITSAQTSGGLVIFNSAPTNRGGAYSTSTGLYTAQVSGLYLVTATVPLSNSTGSDKMTYGHVVKNGTTDVSGYAYGWLPTGFNASVNIAAVIPLVTTDTIQVNVSDTAANTLGANFTVPVDLSLFCVYFLG